MYTIQYRCLYREQWYDDEDEREYADPGDAINDALMLAVNTGRRVRVVFAGQSVVWTT
jgi:hypothetical protein